MPMRTFLRQAAPDTYTGAGELRQAVNAMSAKLVAYLMDHFMVHEIPEGWRPHTEQPKVARSCGRSSRE